MEGEDDEKKKSNGGTVFCCGACGQQHDSGVWGKRDRNRTDTGRGQHTGRRETDSEEQTEASAQEETAAEHTVTYYDSDGTTVLETKTAADGACAEEFTPEKAGETFVGWYATPQMSRKYDFGTQVKEIRLFTRDLLLMWKIREHS